LVRGKVWGLKLRTGVGFEFDVIVQIPVLRISSWSLGLMVEEWVELY